VLLNLELSVIIFIGTKTWPKTKWGRRRYGGIFEII